MKLKLFTLMAFCIAQFAFGQDTKAKLLLSPVQVDTNFVDTFTFTQIWDYPWDMAQHENPDTTHLYHTANCVSNHQGEHQITYCDALLNHDTINLNFQMEPPAYASRLNVSIKNNLFWSDFWATYPNQIGALSWVITKQKLTLDKPNYETGDMVKGYIEVEFTEITNLSDIETYSQKFYYKGYFKTILAH
jgi:hypothetical protein